MQAGFGGSHEKHFNPQIEGTSVVWESQISFAEGQAVIPISSGLTVRL